METKIINVPVKELGQVRPVIAVGSVEMFGVKYAVEQDQDENNGNKNLGIPRMFTADGIKQHILEDTAKFEKLMERWNALLKAIGEENATHN